MSSVGIDKRVVKFFSQDVLRMRNDHANGKKKTESGRVDTINLIDSFSELNPESNVDWNRFISMESSTFELGEVEGVLEELKALGIPEYLIDRVSESLAETKLMFPDDDLATNHEKIVHAVASQMVFGGNENFNCFVFVSLFNQYGAARNGSMDDVMSYVQGSCEVAEAFRDLQSSEDRDLASFLNWDKLMQNSRGFRRLEDYLVRQRSIARKYPQYKSISPILALSISSGMKIAEPRSKDDLLEIVGGFNSDDLKVEVLGRPHDIDRARIVRDKFGSNMEVLNSDIETEVLVSQPASWVLSWVK